MQKNKEIQNLVWREVKSETITPDVYLQKYGFKPLIAKNYETYTPNPQIIENIRKILAEKGKVLKILIIGADWCKDCSENVPKGIKIVKELNSEFLEMHIIYGLKTNPLKKKGELNWHPKASPPEALNPKFDLIAIPIFYFFNEEGKYLGRIVEKPTKGSTLEEDMLKLIEKRL